MHIVVIGLSHKTAPVEQREKAVLSSRGERNLLRSVIASGAVSEVVALSTCNRTELYAATSDPVAAEQALVDALLANTRIGDDELACARYIHRDERAAAQLFRVSSSLDSMVVGESEIQGQVRAAWEHAAEEKTTGPILNQLFRQALEVGKQVRTDTRIAHGPASVPAVAVNLVHQSVSDLTASRVVVVGAGEMAQSVLVSLTAGGVGDLVIVNRTVGTARDLAERFGGRGVGFDALEDELAGADVVISSTDAPHTVIDRGQLEDAMRAGGRQDMLLIDISVPRDIDPAIAGIPGVVLHDIDDLERVVEANLNGRRREAALGDVMVEVAVRGFSEWRSSLIAAPAIRGLRDQAEEIRRAEIDRLAGSWEGLSDDDRERLDILTKAIVNKILHEPTVRARAAVQNAEGLRHIESLRHLFGLDEQAGNGAVAREDASVASSASDPSR
jgi:glutamyl-tRNA reductase